MFKSGTSIFLVGLQEHHDITVEKLEKCLKDCSQQNHKAVGVCDFVEDRFRKRLASWKLQYISNGVGLHLFATHYLVYLSIYSLFRMLKSVGSSPKKIQKSFYGEEAIVRKSLILLLGPLFVQQKRKGVLA